MFSEITNMYQCYNIIFFFFFYTLSKLYRTPPHAINGSFNIIICKYTAVIVYRYYLQRPTPKQIEPKRYTQLQ